MAREVNCAYCGEIIYRPKRAGTHFHDDNCKNAYHAEKRRAERAEKRAILAIEELTAIISGTSKENSILASNLLSELREIFDTNLGTKWQCANCGDTITSIKAPLIPCIKCRRTGFINIRPQI